MTNKTRLQIIKTWSLLFTKMRLRCRLIFIFIMLFEGFSIAQPSYNLPEVIQPSPQSQALTRYGDYPMASFDGLTNITIPLHTITSSKLSLPITMSFHASGRMANEANGVLGMRWTLNCGGLVTRVMKGAPDEWNYQSPFHINFQDNEIPSFDMLYRACPNGRIEGNGLPFIVDTSNYDSEYDIFEYSLPNGKSGHFILKNQNGVKIPMLIPYEPLKIEYVKAPTNDGFIDHITITDDDGTKYIFGKIDSSSANAIETMNNSDAYGGQLQRDFPTAWYLTMMISNDGSDQMLFSYNKYNVTSINTTQSATIWDRLRNSSVYLDPADGDIDPYEAYLAYLLGNWYFKQFDVDNEDIIHQVPMLSNIKFNGGSASLAYISTPDYGDHLLSEMTINNGSNHQLKKIKFDLVKHTGENFIYYLDDLSFYGDDSSVASEKYNFSYYEGQEEASQFASIRKDWWGYSTSYVSNLLPYQSVYVSPFHGSVNPTYQDIGFVNTPRDPNEDAKLVGMIKDITYPTGGQTEFVYENNLYKKNAPKFQPTPGVATIDGPGLRIKEVISKPIVGHIIHKIYKYGLNEDGRGYVNEFLIPGSTSYQDLTVAEGNSMQFWEYILNQGTPQQPVYTYHPEQLGYRTRDYFSDPYIMFDLGGSPIKYDVVTEYYLDDNSIPQQKTQSHYSWGDDEQVSSFIVTDHDEPILNIRKFANPENAWLTPLLIGKNIYSYSNGQFNLIKNETYDYISDIKDEAWDMPTYLHTNISYSITNGSPTGINRVDQYNAYKNYNDNSCSIYGYGFRHYTTGAQLLSHTLTQEYTPNGSIITNKYFDYDSSNLIKSEKIINSNNDTIETSYTYPQDYPNSPVYEQMVQKNILSPVISTIKNINGVQIKKVVANYYNPSTNIFVPQSMEIKNGNNAQEVVAKFNQYDPYGNILEQQKSNNPKETYLWGYAHQYPVAKIIGSNYNTVIGFVDTTKLNNAADYPDLQIRTELNKIRTGLAGTNAQVTTYTYAPLIGMTSATDPSGHTTYYEYDGFGRLTSVRDNNNNIIKRYCYNYAGQQTENCAVVNYGFLYKNTAVSTTLNRNNCSVGYDGDTITYSVPAGKYTSDISQADADQQAQNDITANAQNYANANATCTSSVQVGVFFDDETDNAYNTNIVYQITFTPTTGDPITYTYPEDESLVQVPPGQYLVTISVDGEMFDGYNDGYGSVVCRWDGIGTSYTSQCESYGNDGEFNDYNFNIDLSSSTELVVQLNKTPCH